MISYFFQEKYVQYSHLIKENSEKYIIPGEYLEAGNAILQVIILLLAQKWWLFKDECKRIT